MTSTDTNCNKDKSVKPGQVVAGYRKRQTKQNRNELQQNKPRIATSLMAGVTYSITSAMLFGNEI